MRKYLLTCCLWASLFIQYGIANKEVKKDCLPSFEYQSIEGKYIPILGQKDESLEAKLSDLAEGLPTFCGMQVEIVYHQALETKEIVLKKRRIKGSNQLSYFLQVGYVTPSYTTYLKNPKGAIIEKIKSGGEKALTEVTDSNNGKTAEAVWAYWKKEKKQIYAKLERASSNYQELSKRLEYAYGYFAPNVKVYESEHSEPTYDPAYESVPPNTKGFLVRAKRKVPIKVAVGDELTFIAKGKTSHDEDVFDARGMIAPYQRRYEKLYKEGAYAELMVTIGQRVYRVKRGATITVKRPGEVSLFANANAAMYQKLEGNYEVWVYHNKKLIQPQMPTEYTSILDSELVEYDYFFTPKNELVVGTSEQNQMQLWSVKTGNLLNSFTPHKEKVLDITFLEYDPVMVSVSSDGRLKYSEVISGKTLREIHLEEDAIQQAVFSKNGQYLVITVAGRGQKIYVYDLYKTLAQENGVVREALNNHQTTVTTIAFSKLDNSFLSGDDKGQVFIWDTNTWKVKEQQKNKNSAIGQFRFDLANTITWMEIQTQESLAHVGSSGTRTVSHWEQLVTNNRPANPKKDKSAVVPDAKAGDVLLGESRDGRFMVIENREQAIQIWETAKYNKL